VKLLALKKMNSTLWKYYTYRLTDQSIREGFVIELVSRHNTLQNGLDNEKRRR